MDWVFDHIQIIIAAAGAIAWWLNKRRQDSSASETPQQHQEGTFEDPELAERTRRIREEIQRKIAERARGYPTEQPTIPQEQSDEPPVVREVIVPHVPPVPRRSSTAHLEAQRQAEILEEQATLAERLREAELMKVASLKRVQYEAATADHSAAARSLSRSTVIGDLRDPAALRRAFILREVLGPPVALR
jgi:hypothetical protein